MVIDSKSDFHNKVCVKHWNASMRGEAFGLVCAETPAESYKDVRGNAHPVFTVLMRA